MDPAKDFSHFIAYYLPGTVLVLTVLLLSSCVTGINLLANPASNIGVYTFIFLVGGSILGLIIDEARHNWIDPNHEIRWADKNGIKLQQLIDPQKKMKYTKGSDLLGNMTDFIVFAEKIGLPLYQQLLDEQYYFYEFDINVALSLITLAFVIPIYLYRFGLVFTCYEAFFASLSLIILGIISWQFGKQTYDEFYTTAIDLFLEERIS